MPGEGPGRHVHARQASRSDPRNRGNPATGRGRPTRLPETPCRPPRLRYVCGGSLFLGGPSAASMLSASASRSSAMLSSVRRFHSSPADSASRRHSQARCLKRSPSLSDSRIRRRKYKNRHGHSNIVWPTFRGVGSAMPDYRLYCLGGEATSKEWKRSSSPMMLMRS